METVCGFGGQEEEDMELPPGFRFHPTDEELITHYLAPKVLDSSFCARAIGEVDLNKVEPWDLPWRAKMGEKEWYFFCIRDKKYPTGQRTNRATAAGYWKATGKDKEIYKSKTLVGMKKTLVFYKGRAPRGEKTNWVMHEYRLDGKYSVHNLPKTAKNECVICRIFKKSSGGKKIPISNLMRSNSLTDNSRSSNLPPLMDVSPYNNKNNTQITITARSSGDTCNSHVTCFSDSVEDQKPQTHPLSCSPVSVDFPKDPSNVPPNHSMAYMENFQYGDSGLMHQDNSIMRLLLDNNYGSESKQSLRGYEDHDFNITSCTGPVDIDCLWNY